MDEGDLLAAAPGFDCNACKTESEARAAATACAPKMKPDEVLNLTSDRKGGGGAAKAPGEDMGRWRAGVAAGLLLLPEGVLLSLFSLFDVLEPAFTSLLPPGGDLALPLPRVDRFPLLSALSS